MDQDFSKNITSSAITIRQALTALNSLDSRDNLTLFLIDAENKLAGTLTDGDIRRGLLSGLSLEDKADKIMHRKFRSLKRNKFSISFIEELRSAELELIPLLSENGEIIRIIDLKKKRSILPVDAVIMAGGEGRRLRPMTIDTPKPLLHIGDKPILEHTVERLDIFGIDNIFISVNYLGDKIAAHFRDGADWNVNIRYLREVEPLGTIGAVNLVDDYEHDVLLVMNSDLLTNIDYEDFYKAFIRSGADMGVASIPYQLNVPYAVLEMDLDMVKSLKEKPTYTYYSNAGIYFIKRELLKLIPHNAFFNATDLMEKVIAEKMKLVNYPLLGYWLDIGKPEDYKKAQEDIKYIKF